MKRSSLLWALVPALAVVLGYVLNANAPFVVVASDAFADFPGLSWFSGRSWLFVLVTAPILGLVTFVLVLAAAPIFLTIAFILAAILHVIEMSVNAVANRLGMPASSPPPKSWDNADQVPGQVNTLASLSARGWVSVFIFLFLLFVVPFAYQNLSAHASTAADGAVVVGVLVLITAGLLLVMLGGVRGYTWVERKWPGRLHRLALLGTALWVTMLLGTLTGLYP